jgi:hypothetical protein
MDKAQNPSNTWIYFLFIESRQRARWILQISDLTTSKINFNIIHSYTCRSLKLSLLQVSEKISIVIFLKPVAVDERSEAWTIFDRSEAVIAGSNPALGMDV